MSLVLRVGVLKTITDSFFLIHSDSLCLFPGVFEPLTLRVVTERVELTSITSVTISTCVPCYLFLLLSSVLFLPFVVSVEHFICFQFLSFLSISIMCFFFNFSHELFILFLFFYN